MFRYQPWGLMEQMRREMDRMGTEQSTTSRNSHSDWTPAVDIKEEKDGFTISADIPGIAPSDIEIHAENGMLTIQGARESSKEEEKQDYSRIERACGSFYRRFTLPDSADTDKISAKGENGVLTISITKREEIQPRKIAVNG